jgi:hypothetical protein
MDAEEAGDKTAGMPSNSLWARLGTRQASFIIQLMADQQRHVSWIMDDAADNHFWIGLSRIQSSESECSSPRTGAR